MRLTLKLSTVAAAFVLATAATAAPTRATPAPTIPAISTVTAPTLMISRAATLTQDQGVKIQVKTDDGRGAWYTQPVWIAIGVIALVLIIVLIAMAGRRDTTVIK